VPVADDIEDEVFDEEDLAEGFDAELLEEGELAEGEETEDLDPDAIVAVVEDADDDDDVVVDDEEVVATVEVGTTDDEDDLALDHDVELALDEVLAETMRLTTEIDDDEDAPPEVDDKTEVAESVLPKQDDEFRCRSCRLLKKVSQLADEERSLCRDCV
jgi:hypothetical protein